jgi:hypothetical protein
MRDAKWRQRDAPPSSAQAVNTTSAQYTPPSSAANAERTSVGWYRHSGPSFPIACVLLSYILRSQNSLSILVFWAVAFTQTLPWGTYGQFCEIFCKHLLSIPYTSTILPWQSIVGHIWHSVYNLEYVACRAGALHSTPASVRMKI